MPMSVPAVGDPFSDPPTRLQEPLMSCSLTGQTTDHSSYAIVFAFYRVSQ